VVRSTSARPGKIKKEEVPLLILKVALFGNSNKRERLVRPHLISLYHTQYTCLSCLFRRPRSRFQLRYILRLPLFVLHNTETISFPISSPRFLRYNKQNTKLCTHIQKRSSSFIGRSTTCHTCHMLDIENTESII
jgi:hypothetical protein